MERAERVVGRWKYVTLGSTYSDITFSTGGTVLKVCSSIFIPKRIKYKKIIVILTKHHGGSNEAVCAGGGGMYAGGPFVAASGGGIHVHAGGPFLGAGGMYAGGPVLGTGCGGMYAGGPFLGAAEPPGESKLRSSIGGACLGGGRI